METSPLNASAYQDNSLAAPISFAAALTPEMLLVTSCVPLFAGCTLPGAISAVAALCSRTAVERNACGRNFRPPVECHAELSGEIIAEIEGFHKSI